MTDMYIAACDEKGGIYHYKVKGNSVCEKQFIPLDRPMYMEISVDKLYCVLRDPSGDGKSGIISFDVDGNGDLINKTEPISTLGIVGCHLTVSEKGVFCANYVSGDVFRTPDLLVTHTGKGVHPTRQEKAHTHCTVLTPDNKYICVCDLGIDKIFIYDLELNKISETKFPDGAGPRHIVFNKDGKYMYCVTELSNQVISFKYGDGKLEKLKSISTLPDDFNEKNTAAAIRLDGEYLYTSNRGHNSVAVYKADKENLSLLDIVSCGGIGPRDFNITDNLLVCTNENSNDVTFFELKNGIPKILDFKLEMPAPLNVIFRKETKNEF